MPQNNQQQGILYKASNWAKGLNIQGAGISQVAGVDDVLSKITKVAGVAGTAKFMLTGGPLLSLVLKFLNSSKAKFIKKLIVDNYLNYIKATAGPVGVIAIDVLSAYFQQIARNWDAGFGWQSFKTNITNWFPFDKMKSWLPQPIQDTYNQAKQWGQQRLKKKNFSLQIQHKKVLDKNQFKKLQKEGLDVNQFIKKKKQKQQKLQWDNLTVYSPTTISNWWKGTNKTRQQIEDEGNILVDQYVKNKFKQNPNKQKKWYDIF